MSEPKFTKGEWQARPQSGRPDDRMNFWIRAELGNGQYQRIADVILVSNAHLIAAAPDLYAALEMMVDFFDSPMLADQNKQLEREMSLSNRAIIALAKARGETE